MEQRTSEKEEEGALRRSVTMAPVLLDPLYPVPNDATEAFNQGLSPSLFLSGKHQLGEYHVLCLATLILILEPRSHSPFPGRNRPRQRGKAE